MTIIERITQLIAKEYGPTFAMVVYMALCEYKPDENAYIEYGSIACNKLAEMQDQMKDDDDKDS